MRGRMNLLLDGFAFQNIEAVPLKYRSVFKKRLRMLGRQTGLDTLATAIVFVDDEEMKQLNQTYRGQNRTTDVLSFSAWEGEAMPGLAHILGDVVISIPTATRQANENSMDLGDELMVLAVHGILHLLGFDHERGPQEALLQAECEMGFLDLINMDVGMCLTGRSFQS
jgi:probable rRNA maturation factor